MILTESSKWDQPIRTIVKDMVKIIKNNDTGSWMLPNEIRQEDSNDEGYSFYNVPEFTLYFDWDFNSKIKEPYYLNGNYDDETDSMQVVLYVNPEFYPQSMYNIVGDLNDMVRHEFEHHLQSWGYRDVDYSDIGDESPTNYKYYLQKHEVPAEIAGFRRIVKLRKEPVEKVIRDWFIRNQSVHKLNDRKKEKLIKKLVKKYNEFYN